MSTARETSGEDPVSTTVRELAESVERELRGQLYQELDLLAFALEMEASEALTEGDAPAAARAQQTRLGVRLAQRLAGAVPAPEIERRFTRWRDLYRSKFPAVPT